MDKLSTWRFAAVWLIFFLLAAGYFLSVIKWW